MFNKNEPKSNFCQFLQKLQLLAVKFLIFKASFLVAVKFLLPFERFEKNLTAKNGYCYTKLLVKTKYFAKIQCIFFHRLEWNVFISKDITCK